MKCVWEDLPKPLSCFTIKNTTMVNLNTGKIVSNYSTNTKIVLAQKCVTENGTYYRTRDAAHNYLNHAFKASAFGLPDEKAPSAPSIHSKPNSSNVKRKKSETRTRPTKKTKSIPKTVASNDGEKQRHGGWLSKLFRRKNG